MTGVRIEVNARSSQRVWEEKDAVFRRGRWAHRQGRGGRSRKTVFQAGVCGLF